LVELNISAQTNFFAHDNCYGKSCLLCETQSETWVNIILLKSCSKTVLVTYSYSVQIRFSFTLEVHLLLL